MEKLLFAILLLVVLSDIPDASRNARVEWAIALDVSDQVRAELRVEPGGRVEWKILLRSRILNVTGAGQSCLSHWRPCHA